MVDRFLSSGQQPLRSQRKQAPDTDHWTQNACGIWLSKMLRSPKSHKDQRQSLIAEPSPDQPEPDDREGWTQYWAERGQPWRWEPEISLSRQQELAQRREILPDPEKDVYPFGGIKLQRADIEWLLASCENALNSVNRGDERERNRYRLDLRRANLAYEDLRGLSLSKKQGDNYWSAKDGSLSMAYAVGANFEDANFEEAHLEGANLEEAYLREADLVSVHLEGANLVNAHLENANLGSAYLNGALLTDAHLQGASLVEAHLETTLLMGAHLEKAILAGAHLEGAILVEADLEEAVLEEAHLERAWLSKAKLRGAQLSGVVLSKNGASDSPRLLDVNWAECNLSPVKWGQLTMLGDEALARRKYHIIAEEKETKEERLEKYQDAMRATHQLAVVLQEQGLTFDAVRFAYRAKCLERTMHWYELRTVTWYEQNSKKRTARSMRKGFSRFFSALFSWLFSWFLFIIAGYGYRLRFCLFWYLLVVGGCTIGYLLMEPHYFTWWTALGESVNVFHGRGASPSLPQLTHPARFAMLTVGEAWTGLVIEVILVATLIQRFFGK